MTLLCWRSAGLSFAACVLTAFALCAVGCGAAPDGASYKLHQISMEACSKAGGVPHFNAYEKNPVVCEWPPVRSANAVKPQPVENHQ